MKSAVTSAFTAISILGLCVVTLTPAHSETPDQNIGTLLNEATKRDHERKLAVKQTELDHLREDLKKGADEIAALEKSVQKTGNAATDSAKQLDLLNLQKKRAAREIELLASRIEAERIKSEGLRLLEAANKKAQEAVAKRNEETETKVAIVMAETRQIAAKAPHIAGESTPPVAIAKNEPTLTELQKKLAKAERATSNANYQAREALAVATARLQEAEAAIARAEKKKEETGLADEQASAKTK
jgi:chromosome segregation ATPase